MDLKDVKLGGTYQWDGTDGFRGTRLENPRLAKVVNIDSGAGIHLSVAIEDPEDSTPWWVSPAALSEVK